MIEPRVLIVSESASVKFGGEAILPYHYFRILRRRGFPVWLIVHARTRDELSSHFPGDQNILYVDDTPAHRFLSKLGNSLLPVKVAHFTTGFLMRILSQTAQRRLAKMIISEHRIDVVHQPMPVSPKEPSTMYGLGVPVVIGPMNGAMNYPPAFRQLETPFVRSVLAVGRSLSDILNWLIPGKRLSALLLVANERTRKALPRGVKGRISELVENGVDMSIWAHELFTERSAENGKLQLVFIGRLVDFKSVDLLLEAFREAAKIAPVALTIVGDGPLRAPLEETARAWNLLSEQEGAEAKVFFAGWRSQLECATTLHLSDALVLPSLMDCGGAVVLEAMAAGRAVIASDWGGPADYLDHACGILVKPDSRREFLAGLSQAILRLAQTPGLARQMGRAGREKVARQFDWEIKVENVLELYRSVLPRKPTADARAPSISTNSE